jgi:sec-independent protein translocase protein TatC
MLMLAVPMTVLFLLSEVVARLVDRRRARESYAGVDDDEASDLDYEPEEVDTSDLDEPDDVRRSDLDEPDDPDALR